MASTRLLLGLALGASLFSITTSAAVPADRAEMVARGEYVAVLGDCNACHTAPGGERLAGGLGIKTPLGTLYSTNITPDRSKGIGRYSFEQFERAMRSGVAADGRNLYPAMPYTSYARVSAEDLRALYAYLMQGVASVDQPNKPAQVTWPASIRWGVSLWNAAFHDDAPFKPDPGRDATWNRGAYLVQGLGHCGACHTPRGFAFQEKASTHDDGMYLAGSTIDDWHAPNLRGVWSIPDTALALKTGQNRFGTISGSMVDVVHHSTQYFSESDLVAVATYLQSLPSEGAGLVPAVVPAKATAKLYTTRGGLGYVQFCVECHRADGAGVPDVFPSLAQNSSVQARDPATLVHIVLTGWKTAETAAHPRVYTMPAFDRLSDRELSEILTFMREAWGPPDGAVSGWAVKKLRAGMALPVAAKGAFETPRFADMLGEPDARQLVRGMRLHLETKALLPGNVGNELNCTSCHLNAGTVADGSPFVGVAAFFPGYAPRAGRVISLADRINGCFLRSMNGKALAADSADLKAMVAYFDWMKGRATAQDKVPGRGVGKVDMAIKPDAANGRKVYERQCASCHGTQGEGLRLSDGRYLYPPLWGDNSFNIGAGMARTYTAAAFVKRNMPVGAHAKFPLAQGGLSDQEAVDVAEYFSHQPRPDFLAKVKDWPKDPKPADARY